MCHLSIFNPSPCCQTCDSGRELLNCLMNTWCEKYPDCAEGVVREWQVLGLVTGYFSLCTLCPLFPVALLAPNERCEQLGSAPSPDQFSSHLFPWLLPGCGRKPCWHAGCLILQLSFVFFSSTGKRGSAGSAFTSFRSSRIPHTLQMNRRWRLPHQMNAT